MSEEKELLDDLETLLGDEAEAEQVQERATKDNVAPRKVESKVGAAEDGLAPGEIVIVNPIEGHDDLNDCLKFDDLDDALKEQAGLYAFYSAAAARAQLQYNRAKQNVEQVESRASYHIRQHLIKTGEKFTEKSLDTRVKMTRMYRNALQCQNDAQYIHKLCLSLVEAFDQREQMIIQSCKRAEREMFGGGAHKSSAEKWNEVKDRMRK